MRTWIVGLASAVLMVSLGNTSVNAQQIINIVQVRNPNGNGIGTEVRAVFATPASVTVRDGNYDVMPASTSLVVQNTGTEIRNFNTVTLNGTRLLEMTVAPDGSRSYVGLYIQNTKPYTIKVYDGVGGSQTFSVNTLSARNMYEVTKQLPPGGAVDIDWGDGFPGAQLWVKQ